MIDGVTENLIVIYILAFELKEHTYLEDFS